LIFFPSLDFDSDSEALAQILSEVKEVISEVKEVKRQGERQGEEVKRQGEEMEGKIQSLTDSLAKAEIRQLRERLDCWHRQCSDSFGK
jgi:uncharacterized protein YoxC